MTKTKHLKRVLIMAGGTGGHVFPGLAVANYFRDQGVEVHWLGTSQGLESRLVPEAGLPMHLITISGIRGKGIKPLLNAPIKISKAIKEAMRVIHEINPDVVIGMGGFVSGPGGVASWITKRPLIICEQNAKAGTTNRILATISKRIVQGFPDSFKSQAKLATLGNPVRPEIANLPSPEQRFNAPGKKFRLLVLGGSLGAQALNSVIPKALAEIPEAERPEVWHQTGDKLFEAAKTAYESMHIQANLQPFIKDMGEAYSWADMVICRAGALTVAELCAVGLGAILVPFPYAVDDHQTANAQYMAKHDAALCIQQTDLTATRLADIVREFSNSPEKRVAMAQAAYRLRKVDVAEKIYQICEEVCH